MAERQRKVRIGPLDTVGGVVSEMAKVYRQARREELDVDRARSLVWMLGQMRSALELVVIEARLAKLEDKR